MLGQPTKCIHDNLDCADVCDVTVRVLSRHSGYDANLTRAQVQAASAAARACADSCGEHRDMHEHCRVCEQACRQAQSILEGSSGSCSPSRST